MERRLSCHRDCGPCPPVLQSHAIATITLSLPHCCIISVNLLEEAAVSAAPNTLKPQYRENRIALHLGRLQSENRGRCHHSAL